MGSKSRETIYGGSVRAAAQRATEARKEADKLACEAWNKRMLGFQGPAQPSPALGDALNAGYRYLEVRCLGCDTHQTVALDIVRRPKATPIHELERYMRCKDCSQVRGYPYKRSHLVALRSTKITASDPPSSCGRASDDFPNERGRQLRRPTGDKMTDVPFKVGDRVKKRSGYEYPGFIVSVFTNRAGSVRYVVEADHPAFSGMLHIFNGDQLEHR